MSFMLVVYAEQESGVADKGETPMPLTNLTQRRFSTSLIVY